ncbi:hypothetical protein FACS1894126_2770 [Alphaproteobacteria bacterium]|nr:hypothetical protein FACS1894126_2770 [Alphaproteobacteria bacterium]
MYVLLMEKNVRIFDENWNDNVVTFEDFFANPDEANKHKIIIDRADVDFSLETLHNCNILDAYNALKCMRKIAKPSESIYLLPHNNFNIFKKYEFHVQTSVTLAPFSALRASSLYASAFFNTETDSARVNVSSFKLVTLVENIIAAFCKSIAEINEKTWWIYVAHHRSSGIKIVAGIGDGILLSRMLPNTLPEDVANAAAETIKYLKRFGLKNEIKIITTYENIRIENQEVILIKDNEYEDIELTLLKFLSTNKNIRSIRNCKNHFRTTLQEKHREISFILSACIFCEVLCLLCCSVKVAQEEQNVISIKMATEKSVKDASGNFQFKVNDKNYQFIERLIEILKSAKSPLDVFQEVSSIIKKNKIDIEQIIIEKNKQIKLRTTLTTSLMNKLLRLSNDHMSITVEKTENTNSEYELIDANDPSNKKFGAIICIKMK